MPALWPGATTFPGAATDPGKPSEPWLVARISFDDFDVPEHELTWVDVSSRLLSFTVSGGRDSELEEFDAYKLSAVFDDRDRELDPTNEDSPHFPNVVLNRRIRLELHTLSRSFTVFRGFIDGFRPVWPQGSEWAYKEAAVTATDGSKVLGLDGLSPADPDVLDYDEVVNADDPSFYYRLGEGQGTKLVGHKRIIRYKRGPKKGKRKRMKRWKTRETRAATEGVSGPAGTYVNTPLLGQPGAIAGDADTAVRFRAAQSERATIPIDANDFAGITGLTVECWVKLESLTGQAQYFVTGPLNSDNLPMFALGVDSGGVSFFFVDGTAAGSNLDGPELGVGEWHHLAGVWSAGSQLLYIDGEQAATTTGPAALLKQAGTTMWIGALILTGNNRFADATLDEPAIYEKVLAPTRAAAHHAAAALGLGSSLTGRRIENVLSLVDAFPTWRIQPGSRTMPPARCAGIAPLELIGEAVESEGDPAKFFFDRAGIPTFLAANYRAQPPYDTPSFTFDSAGSGISYEGLELSDEDAFLYNDVRVTTGTQYTARATDATSIGRFGRRVLPLEDAALSDADADSLAAALLARYKDPMTRLTAFTLNSLDEEAREAMLTMEIGDQVQIVWSPTNGTALEQVSHVERVELSIAAAGEPIIGTFAISPR